MAGAHGLRNRAGRRLLRREFLHPGRKQHSGGPGSGRKARHADSGLLRRARRKKRLSGGGHGRLGPGVRLGRARASGDADQNHGPPPEAGKRAARRSGRFRVQRGYGKRHGRRAAGRALLRSGRYGQQAGYQIPGHAGER